MQTDLTHCKGYVGEEELRRLELEAFTDTNKSLKRHNAEYISTVKSITWGESHGVLLDKKGRVFAFGSTLHGRSGLPDKELPEAIQRPTQVTYGFPKPSYHNKIISIVAGYSHTMAVTRSSDIYTWGEGSQCRLGLGFIEETRSTPDQETPYQMENVFDNKAVVTCGCGKTMSGLAMQSGTVYTWGKGDFEKPKADDYQEYSTPYAILEQQQIVHVAFGQSHVVVQDREGQMFGWGEGEKGCLGYGDGRKRMMPTPMSFFENKRVIDVSCGDKFTVVIAEVEGDPLERAKHEFSEEGLLKKTHRYGMTQKFSLLPEADDGRLKSVRQPLCGGQDISTTTRDKILNVINKNRMKRANAQVDDYFDNKFTQLSEPGSNELRNTYQSESRAHKHGPPRGRGGSQSVLPSSHREMQDRNAT